MIQDPTAEDMMAVLVQEWNGLCEVSDIETDGTIAIYWFANNYHGGQTSNLYSALSTSPYKPGPITTFDKDMDTGLVYDMYETLTNEFVSEEE